jgi:transcriptional regulator GlxA family with amidase domain
VREGARALRHTNDSIQEIAWKTGFADQAHFSRTFKASYRTTPTEYRSAHA